MIQTNIVPEEVTGVNFIFQKTSRGPLMQLTHHGLVCLLASAETRTAQLIKGVHTDIFKKNYDKNDKASFDTVLKLQEEWRDQQTWHEENGIIFMNNMPAYRVLDKTIRVSKEWFKLTNTTVNRTSKKASLETLKEEFNTFIDSISIKGTPEFIDWWRDQVSAVNATLDSKIEA